jgi:dTDP-L-rhamnose 4-epimerase
MSVYGEGQYRDHRGEPRAPRARQLDQLRRQEWELCCDGDLIEPVPTPESKQPVPTSVYALNKYVQERLCLLVGEAYGIPTVALRFFNVYGPRQALANPYTGVLAIFSARLLNGKPPRIFEDGLQQRDFVSVHDVKRACRLALETPGGRGEAINIGSGCAVTVREVARRVGTVLGREHLVAQTTSEYRAGDIRHCFADIQRAKQVLGYEPQVDLREGLAELAAWLGEQLAPDRSEDAVQELARRGLTVGAAPRAGDRLA